MFIFVYVFFVVFCVLLLVFLKKIENEGRILIAGIFLVGYLLFHSFFLPFSWFPGALLLALPLGNEKICYDEDVPEAGKRMLKDCFGEGSVLSEGVEKEHRYFDECDQKNVIVHYIEWTLFYKNVEGQDCTFVFDNRCYQLNKAEIECFVERYFSDLTEEFYKKKFWDKTIAGISGVRKNDSRLYFKEYASFISQNVSEASSMFDRMWEYSLTENIDFSQLQYQEVFKKFPYSLHMTLYVDYGSDREQERVRQRQETERKVRQMIEEMISYTDHSLSAIVDVNMMDENGCADAFNFAILEGEYFSDGAGTGYDVAFYESFFGNLE